MLTVDDFILALNEIRKEAKLTKAEDKLELDELLLEVILDYLVLYSGREEKFSFMRELYIKLAILASDSNQTSSLLVNGTTAMASRFFQGNLTGEKRKYDSLTGPSSPYTVEQLIRQLLNKSKKHPQSPSLKQNPQTTNTTTTTSSTTPEGQPTTSSPMDLNNNSSSSIMDSIYYDEMDGDQATAEMMKTTSDYSTLWGFTCKFISRLIPSLKSNQQLLIDILRGAFAFLQSFPTSKYLVF
jgi:hypothetical protein